MSDISVLDLIDLSHQILDLIDLSNQILIR